MESLLRGRWTRWVLFLLGWAALSLLFAPEAYLSFYLRNAPISWLETVELTVINSAIALLFIPGIVFLTRRFPIERGRWQRSMGLHVVACLAFSVAHSGLYAVACHAWRDVGETLFVRFHPNLITYWAFVGFTQAFEYFRKYQQRERDITRLQLQALKSQLQPHFLFNALNTVSAMMHVDVNRADRMLSRLSELLRMTLNNIERQEVRLSDEIAFVEAYLDIERERFGGRLAMRIDAAPDTLDALVPASFLQPLVENCVRHGFATPDAESLIEIRAWREGERLTLTVVDNGRGLQAPPREGVGITNARKRLAQLYDKQSLSIAAKLPRGVVVTVELPFHKEPDEHPSVDRGRRAVGADAGRLAAEG
ncbi:MAG TPA: histidine kinase [Steroidobacteraceae bacterium]|nr:histidine kinase [Steroidobacteraceae bacterium]